MDASGLASQPCPACDRNFRETGDRFLTPEARDAFLLPLAEFDVIARAWAREECRGDEPNDGGTSPRIEGPCGLCIGSLIDLLRNERLKGIRDGVKLGAEERMQLVRDHREHMGQGSDRVKNLIAAVERVLEEAAPRHVLPAASPLVDALYALATAKKELRTEQGRTLRDEAQEKLGPVGESEPEIVGYARAAASRMAIASHALQHDIDQVADALDDLERRIREQHTKP